MSGHSKWSKVKNQKAVTDAKRSQIFSKLARLISISSRDGADPETNPKLKTALEKAKEFFLPKDTIEKAIKRGSGLSDEAILEQIIIEAYGPIGSALIIRAITDNKNRTLSEIRKILDIHGAKTAESGSVRYMFKEIGKITINKKLWNDDLEMLAIEKGAQDVYTDDDQIMVVTSPHNLNLLTSALSEKISVSNIEIDYISQQEIKTDDPEAKKQIENLIEALDNDPDIEEIYSNFKLN